MRHIGRLGDGAAAEKLVDYLETAGIPALTDSTDGGIWDIWVKDEDQVERAKGELTAFLANPQDARYQQAAGQAQQVRQARRDKAAEARRNLVDVRAKWSQPLVRRAPVVSLLIGLSIAVFALTGFGEEPFGTVGSWLLFAWPPTELGGESIFHNIQRGEVWRLVTPMLMHAHLMHIFFNMYLLYMLGSLIETRHGSLFFLVLVLTTAAISNSTQAMVTGHTAFFGMSGVGYALFGYVWMRSGTDPASGYRLSSQAVAVMLIFLAMGFVAEFSQQEMGMLSRVANWVHLGGLVSGGLWGILHRS